MVTKKQAEKKAINYLHEIERLVVNGKQYDLGNCIEVKKAIKIAQNYT